MRIYHNIPALTAYNALNSTNNAMDKTIQKLSTGLRINSAADDAAGFAISEKMRSQISGLEVAIRNTQDASSMLQVADGALDSTNSMLQRMRELAVQASNDTLTAQDRSYIQLEIDQIVDEIDRVAKTTQFNKKRLLDGSSAGITSSSNLDVKVYVNGSLREIDQFGQKKSFEGNYKIKINVDPNQTGQGQVQKSSIMTIKHPNVITDVEKNTEKGITDITVNNLPAANYTVGTKAVTAGSDTQATVTDDAGVDYNVTVPAKTAEASGTVTGAYGFQIKDGTGKSGQSVSVEDYFTMALGQDVTVTHKSGKISVDTNGDPEYDADGNPVPDATEGLEYEISDNIPQNNASILFTVDSIRGTKEDGTIVLKAQSNILKTDGSLDSKTMNNITLKISNGTSSIVDLSELAGESAENAFTIALNFSDSETSFDDFAVGSKFVYNIAGAGSEDTAADLAVTVTADQDLDWPDAWYDTSSEIAETSDDVTYSDSNDLYSTGDKKPLISQPVTYNLSTANAQNKDIHFRSFFLNSENGTVYDSDIILTTSNAFDAANINAGTDELASFTAAYIGKTATGDTKLRDLNTFWNSSGVFMLDNPQTITISQGDGTSTSITLYATDTLNELRAKFNDAIANGLGQAKYLTEGTDSNKFCTFVEKQQGVALSTQGLETVAGTFMFRSLLTGDAGNLTFSGDEDLINTFALNVVQESSTAAFIASIYDAHTGIPVDGATNVKVSDNHLIGVLHPNVDIEFNATAGIKATWSESEDNFLLTSDTKPFEATIHIVDSSTVFQIGANEGEDIAIDIGNMTAGALGVTNINISTRESASKAIGKIDAAINKVSTQRAKIGAYTNALEYTSENLTTTMTNLTAAESRIRDADMAELMMEFVKLQILNQSGTSMLAQANQLPQSVLSLLQ